MQGVKKMKHISAVARLFTCLCVVAVVVACAKPYRLNVAYQTPQAPGEVSVGSVVLTVTDKRGNMDIFSESARKEFDQWDGTFALVQKDAPDAKPVVANDLAALFENALEKRLNAMGIDVVEGTIDDAPLFSVSLLSFRLNLDKRTWKSDITFAASLTRDQQNIASEKVSAQAERTKVMGKGAGEQLIGELFTESINQLNIEKLFEKAGM